MRATTRVRSEGGYGGGRQTARVSEPVVTGPHRLSPSVMIRRVFRNHRGDKIRRRIRIGRGAEHGVNASWIDVVTHDKQVLTPEAYLELLQNERAGAAAH